MKAEWEQYLQAIGIKGPFLLKVENVLNFYQGIFGNKVDDIFISDFIDKEGNRQFESLWLFTSTFAFEAKQFLKEDDFDCMTLKNRVDYWQMKKTDYDFKTAGPKSRMLLTIRTNPMVGADFKASAENCDYLKAIFNKYVMPNIVSTQ